MRELTLPLMGTVTEVSDNGRARGSELSPLGWPDLATCARAVGLPVVGKMRFYTKLVAFDLDNGTVTVQVQADESVNPGTGVRYTTDAQLDALADAFTARGDTLEEIRQALIASTEDSTLKGRYVYTPAP